MVHRVTNRSLAVVTKRFLINKLMVSEEMGFFPLERGLTTLTLHKELEVSNHFLK